MNWMGNKSTGWYPTCDGHCFEIKSLGRNGIVEFPGTLRQAIDAAIRSEQGRKGK
jgi:hypothetical protein